MAEHVEVPFPFPYSFKCSCGVVSAGIEDYPALFADHERAMNIQVGEADQ